MKTKYLAFAAAAFVLASCSNDEDFTPQVDNLKDTPITVTAGVAELATRAGYETNADDDTQSVLPATFYLGIDQAGTGYDYPNVLMTKATESNTYTPESQLLWAGGTEQVSVTAATFSLEGAQTLAVQADQSTADGVKNSDHLLMASTGVTPSDEGISVKFSHLMSKVVLTITLGDEFSGWPYNPIANVALKGTVASNSYTAGTGWAEIATDATTADITPLCNAYDQGGTIYDPIYAEYEVILVPQTIAAGGFTVSFYVHNRVFEWTSSDAITLESGYKYTLALTAGKDKVNSATITSAAWNTGEGDGNNLSGETE